LTVVESTTARDQRLGAGEQPEGTPRRRADATRNIAAILDAAVTCLTQHAQVTMAEIARAAGVGRVTLYAHFPSREALLDAVLQRTITQADAILDASELDEGPADDALRRLLRSSWPILDHHRRLFDVAQRELDPDRLREHHDPVMSRVEELIARGIHDRVFRADLPLSWLVTTVYTLLHAAAEDVNTGRLAQEDAAGVLEATLLSALAPG
jgi:AcrR family transcriptional regulator